MDELHNCFSNMNLNKHIPDLELSDDVDHIIYCYERDLPSLSNSHMIWYPKKRYFEPTTNLYNSILGILKEKQYISYLIELMPLIDEYLEYASQCN